MSDTNDETLKTESKSSTNSAVWNAQKVRMDEKLAKLKSDIQEVKSMDKDLTRQFISLGGIINQIKDSQMDDDDQLDYEEEDYPEDELNSNSVNTSTSTGN